MKKFTFQLRETWAKNIDIEAESKEEAWDKAINISNEEDLDISTADFIEGDPIFIKETVSTKCIACNGSGYYDSTGSPPCGSCDGSGITYI